MRANRALAAATVAAGAVLGFASLAYGCASVTSPYVTAEPNRGQAATVTTVSGGNWAQSSDVTLRWATVEGKELTTIRTRADGSFAARITVPADAAASVYYIVAVQDDTVRRAPFEVVAAGGATEPSGDGAGNVAGSTSGSTSGGTGSSTQSTQQQQSGGTTSSGAVAGSGGLPTPPGSSSSAPVAHQGQPDSAAVAPAPAASPRPAASPAVAERRQGSGVVLGNPAPAPAAAPAAVADEDIAVPAAAATGDVWGGFAEGPSRLAPSLVDLPASGGSTSPAVVGAAMAVLALVGLAGGFATAELRRRRVSVSEGSGR